MWSHICVIPRAVHIPAQNAASLAKREREKAMQHLEPLGVLEGLSPSPSWPVILPLGDSASCASLSSGIPTVPGKVTLQKDAQNLIGISIGGGAQYCPCLYIVQVFDNTPAALDGTVAAGDEITGVNGRSIKGKTKVEVAKMIQEVKVRAAARWGL